MHRFSVAYLRATHKKSSFGSTLTQIDGVGEKKAKALLKTFKTITAIKNASVDELCNAEGINKVIAQKVYDHFHKNLTI